MYSGYFFMMGSQQCGILQYPWYMQLDFEMVSALRTRDYIYTTYETDGCGLGLSNESKTRHVEIEEQADASGGQTWIGAWQTNLI